MFQRSLSLATTIARVTLDLVRLLLLAVALTVAGWCAMLGMLQSDVPWSAVVFAVAYLAAGTWLLVASGQHLTRRWNR